MAGAFSRTTQRTLFGAVILGSFPTAGFAQGLCGFSGSGSGSGAPSISATEVSTAQALELIRKRRDEALSGGGQGMQLAALPSAPPQPPATQPQQTAPVQQAAPVPQPTPPAASQQSAPPAQAPPAPSSPSQSAASARQTPAAQRVVPPPAQRQPPRVAAGATPPSRQAAATPRSVVIKDPAPVEAPVPSLSFREGYFPTYSGPTRGAFAQAFGDIEWRKGLTLDGGAAGALTSRQKTGGFNAGTDWQIGNGGAGATKVFFGVLGTVTSSVTDFGDATFERPVFDAGVEIGTERVRVDGAEEHVRGGGAGVYGFLTANRFSADFLAKIEGFGLDRQDRTVVDNTIPCGFVEINSVNRRGTVDLTTFTLASNVAYRFEFSGNVFIEPTFGVRYTHTGFGSQEGNLPLGFRDGDAFRIQGGARVGVAGQLPNGDVGVVSLTGLLYNDVSISGFSAINTGGFNPAEVDEGETRVLGQLSMSIVRQSGWTYTAQGEVRGGEDLRGFGGKFLMRYDW